MLKPEPTQSPRQQREDLLSQVIEEVVRRRASGETVSDIEILEAHPDLASEMRDSLTALLRVEEAEDEARFAGAPDAATLPHEAFPEYQLIREVHRGGQGIVYRGVQKTTGRQVAIKVMRDGPLAGPNGRARFEREVRILGQLQHPNIVTIHDSGTAAGSFYLVMDFISGQPLNMFATQQGTSIRECLNLFVKICDAVNAAHLRGVIHRDLKPSNICIDERGEPLILDFGLAKMATDDLTDAATWRDVTMTGQFVGSLPWSSPEQAEGPSQSIDLRTDVYSLGVILYHMLTERFPYAVTGNMRDIFHNIIEKEPAAPSALSRDIDEDVDTIVLKCLQKEPDRRYQSAGAIAEDVRRFLTNQPILARAPSTIYQLKKLAYRHKLSFALLSALMVVLPGFGIWVAADLYRDRALVARAIKAEQVAAAEAQAVKVVNDFLVEDLLGAAQPERAQGRKVTVEEVLAAASERVEGAFADQPLVEAAIRTAIGQSYTSIGLYSSAEPHLRSAYTIRGPELGEAHPDTLESEHLLAELLVAMGRYTEADPITERNWVLTRRVFGDEHERTLEAAHLRGLLDLYIGRVLEGEELQESTLRLRRRLLGETHPDTLKTLTVWGSFALLSRKKMGGAEKTFREVLDTCRRVLGETHPQTLSAMTSLAHTLCMQRKFAEAEVLFDLALDGHHRILGDEHPNTLLLKLSFSRLRQAQGRMGDAIVLLRDTVEKGARVLGAEHPLTLQALEALGHKLGLKGEYAESEAIHRQTIDIHRRFLGFDHTTTAHSLECLGMTLAWMGRHVEAEGRFRESFSIIEAQFGATEAVVGPLRGLIGMLAAQNRAEEARTLAEMLLRLRRLAANVDDTDAYRVNCYARALLSVQPADLRDPQQALEYALKAFEMSADAYHYNRYTLALAYEADGDVNSAIDMARRAVVHIPAEVSEERGLYDGLLVRLLESIGDDDAAAQVYRDTLALRRDQAPENHLEIAEALALLGGTLVRHGKHVEAETQLRECLEIRMYRLPEDHWRIGEAMSILGASLAGQGRSEEAEPLLIDGSTVMASGPMGQSDQATIAFDRLGQFYDKLGRSEEISRHRAMAPTP